jgi:hypothetical protein
MTQQQRLMVWILPDHMLNTDLHPTLFCDRVETRIASIEKNCLDLEGLANALILPNHLLGPCNERNRVAGTGLELFDMDMDVDAVVLPRHAGE